MSRSSTVVFITLASALLAGFVLSGPLPAAEGAEGKDHKKEFKGSDEELKTLVTWVLAQ